MEPQELVPDTKDWTWVLERPCPECGLVAADVLPHEVTTSLRRAVTSWREVLQDPGVRERPAPTTWSPLEYAAHVRDVLVRADERVTLMLTRDDPTFPDWDQDATAVADRYGAQDPATVSHRLGLAGETLAERLDGVDGDAWQRPGRRGNGSVFTVDSLARYVLHDVTHHLHDVR